MFSKCWWGLSRTTAYFLSNTNLSIRLFPKYLRVSFSRWRAPPWPERFSTTFRIALVVNILDFKPEICTSTTFSNIRKHFNKLGKLNTFNNCHCYYYYWEFTHHLAIRSGVRDHLHLVTMIQNFYVVRNGLHGYQCYCYIREEKGQKIHCCRQVRRTLNCDEQLSVARFTFHLLQENCHHNG